MSTELRPHHGGCLCGAVRYTVDAPLRDVIACHCSQCRRTSGHYAAMSSAPSASIAVASSATLLRCLRQQPLLARTRQRLHEHHCRYARYSDRPQGREAHIRGRQGRLLHPQRRHSYLRGLVSHTLKRDDHRRIRSAISISERQCTSNPPRLESDLDPLDACIPNRS
jgi:hypothetical protein